MKFLVTLFFSVWALTVLGQLSQLSSNKKISQYVIRHWNAERGINSEAVMDIQQTTDHYLWLATYQGLVRFDGNSFSSFTPENTPSFPSSHIISLESTGTGNLWIGTSRGLVYYSKNQFHTIPDFDPLTGQSIERLFFDSDMKLWIATASSRLFCYENKILRELTQTLQLNNSVVQTISEDNNGYIWIGTNDSRIIRIKNTLNKEYPQFKILNGINHLEVIKNQVLLGTGTGLYSLDINSRTLSKQKIKTAVNHFILDEKENIWTATLKGVMRLNLTTDEVDIVDESNGLPNEIIQRILFDYEGNLWAGTYRDGLLQFTDGNYLTYSKSDGLSSDIITGVSQIDSTHFLLGDELSRFYILDNSGIKPYDFGINIPKSRLKHIYTDKQKRTWISTYSGLVIHSKTSTKLYNRANGFPGNLIRFSFQDSKGTVWIGTKTSGLVYADTIGNWNQINTDNGLCSNYTMSISETKDSTLVVSTVNGIAFIKDKKVIKILNTKNGLPSNFNFSNYPDGKYLWIASNEGIWRYDGKKIKTITQKNGLPSNSVFNFLDDHQGNLWIPCENSILKIPKIQLHSVANHESSIIEYESFSKSDGLKSSKCLGATQSFIDNTKRFWIPTQGGIALVDPTKSARTKLKISARLEKISSDQGEYTSFDSIRIQPGNNRLNIQYTAFYYKQSEKIRFHYKLEPYDKSWVEGDLSRVAGYTNMQPGKYTFLLKATLKNSIKSDLLTYQIIVLPYWWQKTQIKLLAIASGILMIYILYSLRIRVINQHRIELQHLVKERTEQLEDQKDQLEELVSKRTEEIGQQNEELEVQAEFLKVVNEELSVKNDDLEITNKKIEQQKYIIERTNNQLKSSIKYALSIQNAMLQDATSYSDVLDSFIIYRPKDVVSGDFYWSSSNIKQSKGIIYKYVAVIDCTGHGVPGAFMSMIGHQLLDSIVSEKKILSPKDILTELHKDVRKTLRQNETSNTDGMDVCLCLFESSTNSDILKVRYSGAKRVLYRYVKENNSLEKYEPTRKSIGGAFIRNPNIDFKEISFNLEVGDTLFLSTDGYIHQPNKQREAFGSIQLENTLRKNGGKPLTEQEFILTQQLDIHQGDTAQRDDITLIALRRSE